MYLTYEEYKIMGGTLEESALLPLERKARYIINSQTGGKTGERLSAMPEIPEAVKDCMFELVNHLAVNSFDGTNVQSESQSQGGRSESVTYSHLTKEESKAEIENIIYRFLSCVKYNGVSLLYRGAAI